MHQSFYINTTVNNDFLVIVIVVGFVMGGTKPAEDKFLTTSIEYGSQISK